jgi:hypothetical protein
MTLCPNSTEGGCRCPEHHPGLLAYAPAELVPARAAVASLTLVTPGPSEICHGYEHACICSQCTLRAEHGGTTPTPSRALQPWEPRPARHQRAA